MVSFNPFAAARLRSGFAFFLFRLVPPHDWPSRGWRVDHEELAFICEPHNLFVKREEEMLEEVESFGYWIGKREEERRKMRNGREIWL